MYRPRFLRTRRVAPILQSEAAECGLACLAMVAASLGHGIGLSALRQRYPNGLRGSTLNDLVQVAGSLNLVSRPVRLAASELKQLRVPGILHWNLDHFVVLERVGAKSLRVVDPAIGRINVPLTEAAQRFSGVALELLPAADFTPREAAPGLRFRDLMAGSTGLPRALAILFALSLALQVLALLLPFLSQLVIDEVVLRHDADLLVLLGSSYLLLILVQTALAMCRAWVVVAAATRLGISWSARVFRHLLRLPLSYFESRNVGDIQSRFGSVTSLQELLTRQLVEVVVDGLMAITTLLVMLFYNLQLTLVVTLSLALYLAARAVLFMPMRRAAHTALASAAAREGYFLELLRGMLTVKASDIVARCESAFLQRLVSASQARVQVSRLSVWQLGINQLLFGAQFVCVTWLGAFAVLEQTLTVGMLVAFLAYRALFTERAVALIDKCFEFRLARVNLERLGDIVMTPTEVIAPLPPAARRPRQPMLLATRDLGFAYAANAPQLLRDLSLRFEPGEHVVLTGPSGSGKTTLIKLLMGLLPPVCGSIDINGMPLARYGVALYRRHIAAVMQEDHLFSGSLLDNITLFDPQPDMKRCRQCVQIAALAPLIEGLPMQYFTPVGDMGASLSGGQRQRLLLARALYRQPLILFLDEFTSHLDIDSEKEVNERLGSLAITRIVVAHRFETVRHADREIRLGTGQSAHGGDGRD